jgi:serine/threonine protein kinase
MQSQESGTLLQGRYELQGVVERDDLGRLYVASDNRFPGRFVTLAERETRDLATALRLRHQARALAALPPHSAIPSITDTFSEEARIYIVMDYVSGPTLGELWRRHGLPFAESQALSWGLVLADALAHLHEQYPPVIHGTFGLESIAVRPDGAPALRDFGLAYPELLAISPSDEHCAAPERAGGIVNPSADVYGLAATLYALLTGMLPPVATARVQGEQPLLPPRALNPAISLVTAASIESALILQPAERPSMREFHQRLHEALLAQQRAAGMAATDALGTHPISPAPDNAPGSPTLIARPVVPPPVPRHLPRWLILITIVLICLVLSASASALPLFMGRRAGHQRPHATIQPIPSPAATATPHRMPPTPGLMPTRSVILAAPSAPVLPSANVSVRGHAARHHAGRAGRPHHRLHSPVPPLPPIVQDHSRPGHSQPHRAPRPR